MVSSDNVPKDDRAQLSTAASAQNQPIEKTQADSFAWKIENFSRLRDKELFSDPFEVGGYKWRVIIYPNGDNVDCLSIYLDVADSTALPHGWSIDVEFRLSVIDQIQSKFSRIIDTQHRFCDRESDWGFASFMPLGELNDSGQGFLVNDTCIIEADVTVTHVYTIIKVIRFADLVEQIGKDIYFDLVDHKKVRGFHIQKQKPFYFFKEILDKEFGIPVQFQRFWVWSNNRICRPRRPLTSEEEQLTVGQLSDSMNKTHGEELKLFLEVEFGPDGRPVCSPEKTKEDILIFFKPYDPKDEKLRYIGSLFVKSHCNIGEISTKVNKMAGFNSDENIQFYEELMVKPYVLCNRLNDKRSWKSHKIKDGDIICFQKASSHGNEQYRPTEENFCLELSKKSDTYDDVVKRMAHRLSLDDPTKIRLTAHDCHSKQPKSHPVRYRGFRHLQDMLIHNHQTTDILYYEVLDIPLPEFQCLKTLKLAYYHPSDEMTMHDIGLLKQNTVGDLLRKLKTQVQLSHPDAELRLVQVLNHKINQLFTSDKKIGTLDDQECELRVEEIPEEEKNLSPLDRLICVYHFRKKSDQNQTKTEDFGKPFLLVLHEKETLAEIKVRIQKKLQVADQEFYEWKFAVKSMSQSEYLEDSVIMHKFFQAQKYNCDDSKWCLGLEHSDTVPRKAHSLKIHQIDVSETLRPSEARVESVTECQIVLGTEKRKFPESPVVPLATLLAKKARVSTTTSHDSISGLIGLKAPSLMTPLSTTPQQPITTEDHVLSIVSTATQSSSRQVVSPTEPKSQLQRRDCIVRAVQILEPHISEDFARIDHQSPDVIVGESLKSTLESFVGMHQAMQKYKIQIDSKSKQLEELQVTNTSLSIAKVEAEDALEAAEEKASVNESESATLKSKSRRVSSQRAIMGSPNKVPNS